LSIIHYLDQSSKSLEERKLYTVKYR